MSNGFKYLDLEDQDEEDMNQFDKKSVRREKEYKVLKSEKYKKRNFKKDFRY